MTTDARTPTHWLIVTSPGNFRETASRDFTIQGVKSRHRRKAERIHPGDTLTWYITGVKAFAGSARITSPYFEAHDQIWSSNDPKKASEDYPFRVEIEPLAVLDEADFVPAQPLAEAMEYTKRWPAKNWTLAFQGNVHEINDDDFALIDAAIRERILLVTG